MLKLRRGVVTSEDPLTVEVADTPRRAWADPALIGEVRLGDEVLVNTEALDLNLGSGGFDIVHANLTRGVDGPGTPSEHVIKLNYSSLQHPVKPVEAEGGEYRFDERISEAAGVGKHDEAEAGTAGRMPVLVLPLHGHLAPAAYAASVTAPGQKVGYIQAAGGALPGTLSRDVTRLRDEGLLCGHITAGSSYGGEREAITLQGGIAAAEQLGWERVIVGPGPGILGSATRLGHGGLAALDAAHAGLSLGNPVMISPRLSAGDPRPRHRGLSHHTITVLELLLASVEIALPDGQESDAIAERIAALPCRMTHRITRVPADLDGYASSGLPRRTMGRDLDEEPLFFAAPLAAGHLLARPRG